MVIIASLGQQFVVPGFEYSTWPAVVVGFVVVVLLSLHRSEYKSLGWLGSAWSYSLWFLGSDIVRGLL